MQNLSSPHVPGISASDKTSDDANPTAPYTSSGISGLHKESEPFAGVDVVPVEHISHEIEVSPELEAAGVQKHSEQIDLPPDVAKMGVEAVGPAQPVTHTGAVQLPISDDQVMTGLHAQILSSLRWLAEWSMRRLKLAHINLKKVGDKTVRETF